MNTPHKITQFKSRVLLLLAIALISGIGTLSGQEIEEEQTQDEKDTRPVRSTFQSAILIEINP